MAKKPSIAEIKRATLRKSPHFFDRETLKFFGQKMSSFKVAQSPRGRIFIYARMYDRGRTFMGFTFREFTSDGDLKLVRGVPSPRNLSDINTYVRKH